MITYKQIRLGDRVEDRVTGLKGIAVAGIEYLNGCIQICVQPRVAEDAMKIDSHYIDVGQLVKIGHGLNHPPVSPKVLAMLAKRKRTKSKWSSGGPSAFAPKRHIGPKP